MPYSQGFKVNVNKLNAEEALLILMRIEHPFISDPIRLVNDSSDFVFQDELYVKMPFRLKRQDDVQGELPKVNLIIPNVGRSLVRWIDSSGGGKNSKITVILARRSSQVIEESITFGINTVSINSETVTFTLVIQNNLVKRAVKWVYDMQRARGLF